MQEGYWHLENDGNGSGGNSGNSNNGNNGKSELAPGHNGNANKGNSANAPGQLKKQENAAKENPLKMKTEETRYLYEGFSTSLMKEYTPEGSPLMQYYTANNSVVASKMFGLHGRNLPGREPTLKTTGGMMYYHYDGMRNVTELTDRHGSTIEEYRYDVFGGLFTGITAPFNTKGIAGHEYDPKAGLVNMHARWYTPEAGRFIAQDPYRGDLLTPYTQNRYAYVGNNPVNRWDPLGYSGEPYDSDDEYEMGGWIWPLKSLIRDIDEYTYEYDTWKGSDGWYTDWYLSIITIKEYRIDWYLAKETNSGWVDEYLSTTYETESYEYYSSGSNFEPFTPQEWYQENSGVLNSYGQLPEGTPVRESAKISISYDNLKNNLIQQTVENKLDKTIVQVVAPQETVLLSSGSQNNTQKNTDKVKQEVANYLRSEFYYGSAAHYYDQEILNSQLLKDSGIYILADFMLTVGLSTYIGVKSSSPDTYSIAIGAITGALIGALEFATGPGFIIKGDYDLERNLQIRQNLGDLEWFMIEREDRRQIIDALSGEKNKYQKLIEFNENGIKNANKEGIYFYYDNKASNGVTRYTINQMESNIDYFTEKVEYIDKLININRNYEESEAKIEKLYTGY